uniref:Uncharacterized protein n=1 Tax=Rhizophora mucronata TaxID=61149 RepID=A0A2P2JE74_RHIMU
MLPYPILLAFKIFPTVQSLTSQMNIYLFKDVFPPADFGDGFGVSS